MKPEKLKNDGLTMIGVRVTPEEKSMLERISDDEDRSLNGVVRQLIKRKINNYRRKLPK